MSWRNIWILSSCWSLHVVDASTKNWRPFQMRPCFWKKAPSQKREYQDFAEQIRRDQFFASLTTDALRVKLIGKRYGQKTNHRQKIWGNHVCESANENSQKRNTHQEQVNNTTKTMHLSQCFWCGGKHQQPRRQQWGKNVETVVSQAILRTSADVEHNDKLKNSNPILSLKTQTRMPSSRIATEQNQKWNYASWRLGLRGLSYHEVGRRIILT